MGAVGESHHALLPGPYLNGQGSRTRRWSCRGYASIADGYVEVQILNLSRSEETIAHSPVALLEAEYYVHGVKPGEESTTNGDYYGRLSEEQKALVDSVKIDPHNRLSVDQKQRARQLVAKHVDAFATDPKNPVKTHLMQVELTLKPDAV